MRDTPRGSAGAAVEGAAGLSTRPPRHGFSRDGLRNIAPAAVVTFMAVFGVAAFIRWNLPSGSWGIDTMRMLYAGARLDSGTSPWVDPTYYYAPLMALVAVPFTKLPAAWVVAGWAAAKVIAVGSGAWILAPSRTRQGRALAVIAALTFLPVLEGVWQGNVSVPIVAAMALCVWGPPDWRGGIAMGLIFAVAPKPILLPFAAWMLVWRPRAFAGAVGVTALAVIATLPFLGVGTYLDWIGSLRQNAGLSTPLEFQGNIVLAAVTPQLTLPAAAVTLLGLAWVLGWRDELTGLVWACAAGVFLTPFGGEYSMVSLLVPAAAAYARASRRTLALGPIVQLLLPVAFSAIAALVLAVSLTLGATREARPVAVLVRELASRPSHGRAG